jgi:hypothetical protein
MMKIKDIVYEILRGNFDYPSSSELDELAYQMRDLIISLRLMPAEVRILVLRRIFWVSKILQTFLILSAAEEKELPVEPLRHIFRYFASSIRFPNTDFFRKVVVDPEAKNVGVLYHYHQPPTSFRPYLPYLKHGGAFYKHFLKTLPIRQKRLANKLKPPAEKRATQARVYSSLVNPSLYIVMNKTALGRGNSISEAAEDFVRRWRLLVSADIPSRLPSQKYIEEFKLEPCGIILVVEYEDGEVRWKFDPIGGDLTNERGEDVRSASGELAQASDSPSPSGGDRGKESGERA